MERLYSFVIPAYKASFLKEAIDSILAQTYTNFELIIVNDASPEDIESIVNSYEDYRIRYYVNSENIGGKNLVAQWNKSISYAKGDYLILASDDDIYFPAFLKEMDTLVSKYPNKNVYRPRIQRIDAEGKILNVDAYLNECVSIIEFLYYWSNQSVSGGIPFYVFKLSELRRIGGFREYPLAWHCDDDVVIRLGDNGIVSSSEILFSFRMSGQNISTRVDNICDLQSKILATVQFFGFLSQYLSAKELNNQVEILMKERMQKRIEKGWLKDALFNHLKTVSYKKFIKVLLWLKRLDIISFKDASKFVKEKVKRYINR